VRRDNSFPEKQGAAPCAPARRPRHKPGVCDGWRPDQWQSRRAGVCSSASFGYRQADPGLCSVMEPARVARAGTLDAAV